MFAWKVAMTTFEKIGVLYEVLKVSEIPLDYSSIAQLVEHAAVNRAVVGSSPTRGADCSIADFAIEFFTLQEIP